MISSILLASCSLYQNFEGSVEGVNPLDPAGSTQFQESVQESESSSLSHSPGTFLATKSSNTALFSKFPSQSDQPVKTLSLNTEVKVISSKASYTKVEVVETGEVGFVPTVLIGEKRPPQKVRVIPSLVEDPVLESLPPLLPEGATAEDNEIPSSFSVVDDLPFVAPDPENKGIIPPEVIDPLLPAE